MSYPLGTPTNRPPAPPSLTPVPGRPNWFTTPSGDVKYVEPPKPPNPWAKFMQELGRYT